MGMKVYGLEVRHGRILRKAQLGAVRFVVWDSTVSWRKYRELEGAMEAAFPRYWDAPEEYLIVTEDGRVAVPPTAEREDVVFVPDHRFTKL